MDIDKLRRLGIELGYEGDDLKGFVRDQQTILREERVAEREKEKEERELEREKMGKGVRA